MTKSNFKKNSYDVIAITSPKHVTKLRSQDFFHFKRLPIKFFGYASH